MKILQLIPGFLLAAGIPLAAQIEVVSGGNVGVGTSTPGNKFTVEGSGDVAALGSAARKFYFTPDTNGVGLFTGASKTGNGLYADIANNVFAISTNSVERLRVDSSGKIGIGTSSPSSLLSVGGNPAAAAQFAVLGGAGTAAEIQAGSSNNILNLRNSAGTAVVVFKENGTVGVGTTSPSAGLHVIGNVGREVARFQGSTDSSNYRNFISLYTTSGAYWWEFSNQDAAGNGTQNGLAFRERSGSGTSVERVFFANGGNVGIGTMNPSQKLEVNGSIRAAAFISNTTTYADFVFDPGYRLPALSEVEAQIKELGHLPGIPSEAEAKEHGIDLAAMQVKLLQKVEELTLYVIDLKKENVELRRRAERLERISTP